MLTALRSAAETWVAKILLLLLVVSFGVWGISSQTLLGGTGNTVIAAGDTTVSQSDFRLAYDRQVGLYAQQFGQRLTREQVRAFGIEDQVVSQLVAGALLDEQARTMGLGVSRDRVAVLTGQDTAFHGADGAFNRRQFEYVLQQVGMRPEDYLRNREQVAVRQQIVEAVSDGMNAPDTFLRAVALYRGEDRTVDFITMPRSLAEPAPQPDDAALQTYFDANKAAYAAPEYRKISYVRLEPGDVADPAAVSDEDVQRDYDANKARFSTPERRKVEQLIFSGADEARAAVERIRGGATFESAVTAEGKTMDDVQLGTLAKSEIADPAIADAVFALQPNEVSDVVVGNFGSLIVRTTEITPEVVRPLAEVQDQIRRDLALGEASRVLLEVHDQFEDARGGGATLAEAAEQTRLQVRTIDAIDRQAMRPDGTVVDDIPVSQQLLAQAFEVEQGADNPSLQTESNGYVFFEVDGITQARDRTLDEVRDRVVEDWQEQEVANRLETRANELKARIEGGETLDAIAAELSLTKQTKRGLRRDSDDPNFGREGVAAVFGVPQGKVGVVAAPQDGARLLFAVTESFEPVGADAASLSEQERATFSSGVADDLLDQLVSRLQGQYEVTVDRSAIERALAF